MIERLHAWRRAPLSPWNYLQMSFADLARRWRRASRLADIEWFWPLLRAPYDGFLRLESARGGIPRTINGKPFRFRYPYGKLVAADYETHLVGRLRTALEPGMTFFDIGASFGVITLEAAKIVGPEGRVYAFEPMATTALALREHLALNKLDDRVEVVEAVVDERPGEVEFWEPISTSSQTTNMMASISAAWVKQRRTSGDASERPTPRRAISIDEFCARAGLMPDVVKIDVEGAEGRVLRGAELFLRRREGCLFLETHPMALETLNESEETVMSILSTNGWTCKELDWKSDALGNTSTRTLLCVPTGSTPEDDQRSYAP
jgi:FkbM family methyltransferase